MAYCNLTSYFDRTVEHSLTFLKEMHVQQALFGNVCLGQEHAMTQLNSHGEDHYGIY
jgi:hypothetical protein